MIEVKHTVREFIKGTKSEVLAICGGWGVGKTYLWNSLLQQERTTQNLGLTAYGYVSLFGVSSLDQLKLSLFENTIQLDLIPNEQSSTKRNLSRVKDLARSVYAGEFQKAKQQILVGAVNSARATRRIADAMPSSIASPIKGLTPLFFSSVHDQFVCIDDIERRGEGLKLNEILGLVTFLKEERKCRVVLLLNSNSLEKHDQDLFNSHLEKVVDTVITMDPTCQEAIDIAFDGKNDLITDQIKNRALVLDIRNVRVLRKIEQLIQKAVIHLKAFHPKVNERAIFILTLVGWTIFEPKASPKEWFENVYRNAISPPDDDYYPDEGEDVQPTSEEQKMSRYGFTDLDTFDLVLIKEALRGYFDSERTQNAGSLLQKQIEASASDETLRDAWRIAFDSFDKNENAVVATVVKATLDCCKFASIADLNKLISLLVALNRTQEAQDVIDYFQENRKNDTQFWNLGNAWFEFHIEPMLKSAIESIKQEEESYSFEEIILKMGARSSSSHEEKILSEFALEEFERVFLSKQGQQLNNIISSALYYANVSNCNPHQKTILEKSRAALLKISKSSALNSWRVNRYSGVK